MILSRAVPCTNAVRVFACRWRIQGIVATGTTVWYVKRSTGVTYCLPLPRRETRLIVEQQIPEINRRSRTWKQKCRTVWRVCYLSMILTPLASSALTLYAFRRLDFLGQKYQNWLNALDEAWWALALRTVEVAGPTFIKLCQWAATRNDIFPEAMTTRFTKLQDAVRPHSMQHTAKILKQCFGTNWQERLVLTEDQLLGSGCIAQVYRGKVTDTKGDVRDVAVKVVHPGVREVVEIDVSLLRWFGNTLEKAMPSLRYLGVKQCVHNFEFLMWRQLDLRHEATNLQRLADLFHKDETVVVPRPIDLSSSSSPSFTNNKSSRKKQAQISQDIEEEKYKTSRRPHGAILSTSKLSESGGAFSDLLVEEYVEGRPIVSYISAEPDIRSTLAHRGAKVLLRMVLQHNFVHGDLHPGNVLVTKDLKICLLDAGICIELPNEAHSNMVKLLRAMLESRGRDAAKLMLDHGRDPNDTDPKSEERFIHGISRLVENARDQTLFESIGDYYSDICNLAVSNRVTLDASFISVALAVKIVEGFVTDLVPNFPILDIALPMFLKAQFNHAKKDGWNHLSSYSKNILQRQAAKASDSRRRALREIYAEYYHYH